MNILEDAATVLAARTATCGSTRSVATRLTRYEAYVGAEPEHLCAAIYDSLKAMPTGYDTLVGTLRLITAGRSPGKSVITLDIHKVYRRTDPTACICCEGRCEPPNNRCHACRKAGVSAAIAPAARYIILELRRIGCVDIRETRRAVCVSHTYIVAALRALLRRGLIVRLSEYEYVLSKK